MTTVSTPAITPSGAVSSDKTGDLHLLLGQFLEAQRKVMVQAAASQGLPPLPKFTGDSSEEDDNNFHSLARNI